MSADFGFDLLCLEDFADDLRLVSGPDVVKQHVFHLLTTNALVDVDDFGIDLRILLHDVMDEASAKAKQPVIDAVIQRDPRVLSSQTTVTFVPTGDGEGQCYTSSEVETSLGPFELVTAVGNVTVEMLEAMPPTVNAVVVEEPL